MVFPSGFEPLAFHLGGGRSIQLSYGNIFKIGHSPMVQKNLRLGAKSGAKILGEPEKLLVFGCFTAYLAVFCHFLNPWQGLRRRSLYPTELRKPTLKLVVKILF